MSETRGGESASWRDTPCFMAQTGSSWKPWTCHLSCVVRLERLE